MNNNHYSLSVILAAILSAPIPVNLAAEELPISDTPLFLSSAATPNVFFLLDDSGSMDYEILTEQHWHYCAYNMLFWQQYYAPQDWNDPENLEELEDLEESDPLEAAQYMNENCGELITSGLWAAYHPNNAGSGQNQDFNRPDQKEYIYANPDNVFGQNCGSALEACDTDDSEHDPYPDLDWRIYSSDFNKLFFNPLQDYLPWDAPCNNEGARCPNALFTNAASNPWNIPLNEAGQVNSGQLNGKNLDGFAFEVWFDDAGYSDDQPRRGVNANYTSGANGMIDVWDTHIQYVITENAVQITRITYNPGEATLNNDSGLGITLTTLTPTNCFLEFIPGFSGQCPTLQEFKQDIANWYQYYRKRSYVAKNAIASVINTNLGNRYGLTVLNQHQNLFVEMPTDNAQTIVAHNNELLEDMNSLVWDTSGTPLRRGLQRAGRYYADQLQNHDSPIIGQCQKNFTILFTDGYWNGDSPQNIGDSDDDDIFNTLADVAHAYYDTDLSPSLPNTVATDDFDNNNRQHMVTFTVGYGVSGNLVDTNADGWPDRNGVNLTEDSNWGNPFGGGTQNPAKIDDLWHAAFNSKGKYINASTSNEVVGALQDALESVERRTASGVSVALSSGITSSDTRIYQARFDSTSWTGELLAYSLDPITGQLDNLAWPTGAILPDWDDRVILTHTGTSVNDSGASFTWSDISDNQKTQLQGISELNTPDGITNAQRRLNYLRGHSQYEQRLGNGMFRNRPNTILGDIINSAPIYSGTPNFPYNDFLETGSNSAYSQFVQDHQNRTPMVFVGANDGMLHGFNAVNGEELIAYVPRAVFGNLRHLSSPEYSHRFYVDGTPTIGDAYIDTSAPNGTNKSWHTVLVGGLNKGGQGIYALDITNPGDFSENHEETVLWEFTDADDHDIDGDGENDPLPQSNQTDPDDSMRHALGDTFSRPAIVRLNNGQWAAVFGNGYNSNRNDGHASNNGNAVLYILDMGTGRVIRKISTLRGSNQDPAAYENMEGDTVYRQRANGLATTAPVDINGDHSIDFIYAGDLFGNLWKFDLRSENPADWGVYHGTSDNPQPMFTACSGTCISGLNNNHQPITTRPEVGRARNRNHYMVFFGTGQYLGTEDITNTSLQSFYAIVDNTSTDPVPRTQLLQQTIVDEPTFTYEDTQVTIRITSDQVMSAQQLGWYMDMNSPVIAGTEGERIVHNPLLRSGRIIFPTTIPDSAVCGLGGSSWLMELNAYTGSRLTVSPFDLTGEGDINNLDLASTTDGNGNSQNVPASGIRHSEIITTPGILLGDSQTQTETKITSGTSGNIRLTKESIDASAINRQSWRQLR